jgi:MoxR-like ATPase
VEIHPDIIKYIVTCVRNTRGYQDVLMGASPRTGVKVSRLARALALIRGHNFVTIDLVKEIFMPTVCHRIVMNDPAQSAEGVLNDILKTVPIDTR